MSESPSISIVTPSFNQAPYIEEALASVQIQGYKNCEHLVMDGMSTDGTVDILRNLNIGRKQSNVVWVSEQDSGQSEALNKGFRLAKGEIIGWLNSDDRYRAGCFEHVIKIFQENPKVDIIYGDYMIVDELGRALKVRREIEFDAFILLYHRILYIPTTATFFRRRIFEDNNWLDEKLQYAMDLEFFIRLSALGYRFKHVSQILADFRLQPNSKTCLSSNRQLSEHQQVVFAVAPILHRFRSPVLRSVVLALLRFVAGIKRYFEKMRRGYYWEQLRSHITNLDSV
jgi:glycosyltransferase involved in cell wall biosynthesis